MDLRGKSAIVTGSTSGIGQAIARRLAQAGANVMMNGFGALVDIEANRAALEKETGQRVLYNGADMSKPAEIVAMIEEAHTEFGTVDILVNNAGIQHVAPVDEFPVEKWDQIIAINLNSAFHTMRSAVPYMKENGWGRIINVASAHGLRASAYKSAYVTAKHGILGLTKTVALETAEQGITCNAICPGYVKTPLVEGQIPDQAKAHNMSEEEVVKKVMLTPQPTKKFVEVSEIADTALFLCSQSACSITGTSLSVDGGWTAK